MMAITSISALPDTLPGGTIGAVDVTNVEVVGQHIECGGGEFFGNQNDGSHSYASRDAFLDERADMWAFIAAHTGASLVAR